MFFRWLYSQVYNAITSAFQDAMRDVNAASPEVQLVRFSVEAQKALPAPPEEQPTKRARKA